MPRPPYQNLSDEKRARLHQAVAAEVLERGLSEASLNRILERAGFSKGVAYYYFEDRDDLLATVLREEIESATADVPFEVESFNAEDFWSRVEAYTTELSDPARWDPWLFAAARAIYDLPSERRRSGAMGDLWALTTEWVTQAIARGRELGVVRDDLPAELLVAITTAVGETMDQWFLRRFEDMPESERICLGRAGFDCFRRLLEKPVPA
jgi:AcrR family transcriptional regulator